MSNLFSPSPCAMVIYGLYYSMKENMKNKKNQITIIPAARRKAKRDIAHLTKLGILKKVK